jgi:hypothetical protein
MKNSTYFVLCFLLVILWATTNAQQQKPHEKGAYVDSLNRYYMQTSLPIYLYISHKPNDKSPTALSQTNDDQKKNEIEPFYMDGDGVHHIRHFDAIDKKTQTFVVHADGKAPATKATFENCPVFTKGQTIYYGIGLKVPIFTTDEMSGIEKTFYSINGEDYKDYAQTIDFNKEGQQVLKFYAVDHVGNAGNPVEHQFIVDLSAPATKHILKGLYLENRLAASSQITLEAGDNFSGVAKTFFRFDDGPETLWLGGNLNFYGLKEGEHTLTYYSVDNVQNKEKEVVFEFFYDKSAPIIATDILGDRFIVNDQIYFSGRTKLKITTVDNKAGVQKVMFAVDDLDFKTYDEPFYLPGKPGIHIIRYFAEDSLANKSLDKDKISYQQYLHRIGKVYVDLVGPSLGYKYIGNTMGSRDTTFINAETKIELNFADAESGPQKLNYAMDGVALEIPYKEPFNVAQEGFHKVEIIGYDNVNNRNIKTFSFIVDKSGPEIMSRFSVKPIAMKDGLEVYPPFVVLFLAPVDNLTGIGKISYVLNSELEKEYQKSISNFKKGELNTVKVKITDILSNQSESEIKFYINDK